MVALAAPAQAASRPDFELPFPCDATGWWAIGRAKHGTSQNKWPLDFNWGSGSDDKGKWVVASAEGKVIQAGGDTWNTVQIDHGNGWSTVYRHMSNIQVKKGDKVYWADRLGKVSDVGSKGSYHLHYEQLQKQDGRWKVVQSVFAGKKVPDVSTGTRYWAPKSKNCIAVAESLLGARG